jgi:hypothetical protein
MLSIIVKSPYILLYLCLVHSCINLRSQESKSGSKLSGIDISIDWGNYQTTFKRELYIVSKLVSEDQAVKRITPGYSQAYFINGFYKVNAELVFTLSPAILKNYFHNSEVKVGLSFLTANSTVNNYSLIRYDSMGAGNVNYIKTVSYNYYFHQEQLLCTYLLNSRVFMKNFRAYIGLGCIFSLGTWKGAHHNSVSSLNIGEYTRKDSIPYLGIFILSDGQPYCKYLLTIHTNWVKI